MQQDDAVMSPDGSMVVHVHPKANVPCLVGGTPKVICCSSAIGLHAKPCTGVVVSVGVAVTAACRAHCK
jgi:hypothetical protein